jgi:hypothetical protein
MFDAEGEDAGCVLSYWSDSENSTEAILVCRKPHISSLLELLILHVGIHDRNSQGPKNSQLLGSLTYVAVKLIH